DIPMRENPHVLNPPQEYLASANQMTTDSTYPYWYNGYFKDFRAWRINEMLKEISKTSVKEMKEMQNDVRSFYFEKVARRLDEIANGRDEEILNSILWLGDLEASERKSTNFQTIVSLVSKNIWEDEFTNISQPLFPKEERTMQLILTDTASKFYDDKRTEKIETLKDIVQRSFQQTKDSL